MPDYKKTKIYYIPVGNKRYYGHTTKTLSKRKTGHKYEFKKHNDRKLYKTMYEAGMTADDIQLVFVEDFPCENIQQAKIRERYWIEKEGLLNARMPSRTRKEYRKQSPAYPKELKQQQIKYHTNAEYRQNTNKRLSDYNKNKWKTNEEWRTQQLTNNSNFYKDKWANDEEWRLKR